MLPLPPETSLAWLVLAWLAVWRVAALLCYERGPFAIVDRARAALARMGLHQLVTCFHCVALWVSVVATLLMFGLRWATLVVALAVAGAASITERLLGGGAPKDGAGG